MDNSDNSSHLNRFRLTGPKASVTLLSVLQPFNNNNKVEYIVDDDGEEKKGEFESTDL